jgi:hypothetical protein
MTLLNRAVAVWSGAYAAAGLFWALGGAGYPFAESTRARTMGAVLVGLDPTVTGLVIGLLGLAGLAVASLPRSRVVAGFAWAYGLALVALVPDGRLLLSIGELLLLHTDRFEVAAVHQLWAGAGGLLWIALALQQRGPRDVLPGGRHPGRRITYAAAVLPLLYAIPRLVWAAGWPFGLDPATTVMVSGSIGRVRELVFGLAVCGGAALTLGLTHRWGEIFPRWLPLLGGRRVPSVLATIPASVVAIALIGAGFTIYRALLAVLLSAGSADAAAFDALNWAAWIGGLIWLPWGLALAAATYAYHRRRRACGGGAGHPRHHGLPSFHPAPSSYRRSHSA